MKNIKKIGSKLLYRGLCILFLGIAFLVISFCITFMTSETTTKDTTSDPSANNIITEVNFSVPYEALNTAMNIDINSSNTDNKISWIDLLAYYAASHNKDFSEFTEEALFEAIDRLNKYDSAEKAFESINKFSYYKEAYTAVLGNFLGYYKEETGKDENNKPVFEVKYGLKVFSPIAKAFSFSDYDDFGATRTYGYTRPHLGHDIFAETGTPVIAIESGIIETMGWNQYGGWRIGIRSYDKKRYYYYAHLRKNRPFQSGLEEGTEVNAGDVIGYVGRTGYSIKENVNNIEESHLHIGLQLIFDESQKESNNEIWIDMYNIIRLLNQHKSEVYRDNKAKEFYRKNQFIWINS